MSCTKLMSHVASNKVQGKASVDLEIDLHFQKSVSSQRPNWVLHSKHEESHQEFISYK